MIKVLKIFVILLLINGNISAQAVKFTASAKKVVAMGEDFKVNYTLNAEGTKLILGKHDGLQIVNGPFSSHSSNIQFINGKMSKSVNFTYSYVFRPAKVGTHTIEPAEITSDGEVYTSNVLQVEVVQGAAATSNNNSSNSGNNTGNNTKNQTVSNINGEDIFVRLNISKSEVYQGEHIYAVIKIYTRLNLAGFEEMNFPSFKGFYSSEIETPNQISLVRENVNGKIYNVGILKKVLLFPQRSGEIEIEPVDLTCVVQQQVRSNSRSIFDNFFGRYQNVSKKIRSPKLKIKVKPLPANKPADYNGAVGSFNLSASLDNNEVKTNDAITLKVKIAGNGNLKLVDLPEINFPPDFEVYDPKVKNKLSTSAGGVSGSKSIDYLIIPRHPGTFRIPPVTLSYFDPSTKNYKKLSTEEFTIVVTKGSDEESTTVVSGIGKEDIRLIGSDIRYIKINDIILKEQGASLFGSWKLIAAYIGALVLFIMLLLMRKEQVKRNANVALVKNKKANKVAGKRLKKAQVHLKNDSREEFYEEILKALWGYLSDKLSIPVAELSKESTQEELVKRKVEEELTKQFINTVDECEYARFAPNASHSQMDDLYSKTSKLISKLEQNLR